MKKALEDIVADLTGHPVANISDTLNLDEAGLGNSLKRALLIASIRRHLGKDCMQAGTVKTFADLKEVVSRAASA